MKLVVAPLAVLFVISFPLNGEVNATNSDEHEVNFINPSNRVSTAHQSPQQKLYYAYQAAQNKILSKIVWNVDPNKQIDRIEVRIGEQMLYVYQNNVSVGSSPVSTAREGYVTPLGSYKITDKKEQYFSSLYGEFADANGKVVDWSAVPTETPPPGAHYVPSPMPFFLRLTDEGVGLHGGFLPGYPASHGCIRLPNSVAENIFKQVSIGTQVDIVQ